MTKEAKIYNVEKTASSISGVESVLPFFMSKLFVFQDDICDKSLCLMRAKETNIPCGNYAI